MSYKELRFYCKRNNITYTGKHKTKNSLIELILKKQCPELLKADFSTVDDISSTSGQKNIHCEEIVSSEIQWVENRPLVDKISAHNQEQINQEQNTCHVHEKNKKDEKIESIFHELGINYTDTNEANSLLILKQFAGDKSLLKKYLINIHNQLKKLTNIKNLAALFSKKLKEIDFTLLKQIKIEEENKKNESQEKVINMSNEQNQVINNFLNLDKKVQENFVHLAEEKYFEENPTIKNSELFRTMKITSYRVYLRTIYQKLLDILKIELPELIEVGE